jgi:hypothetical protein
VEAVSDSGIVAETPGIDWGISLESEAKVRAFFLSGPASTIEKHLCVGPFPVVRPGAS